MEYQIEKTELFDKWFKGLKDLKAKARIGLRLKKVAKGHFGDCKPIGADLFELRFFFGPGYRIYYVVRGERIIVLLNGGDKSSQARDIEKAKRLARGLE
jgi:putative addiction module killer protein